VPFVLKRPSIKKIAMMALNEVNGHPFKRRLQKFFLVTSGQAHWLYFLHTVLTRSPGCGISSDNGSCPHFIRIRMECEQRH
jgi:hypothetical protein